MKCRFFNVHELRSCCVCFSCEFSFSLSRFFCRCVWSFFLYQQMCFSFIYYPIIQTQMLRGSFFEWHFHQWKCASMRRISLFFFLFFSTLDDYCKKLCKVLFYFLFFFLDWEWWTIAWPFPDVSRIEWFVSSWRNIEKWAHFSNTLKMAGARNKSGLLIYDILSWWRCNAPNFKLNEWKLNQIGESSSKK